jgi:hypothetical protein
MYEITKFISPDFVGKEIFKDGSKKPLIFKTGKAKKLTIRNPLDLTEVINNLTPREAIGIGVTDYNEAILTYKGQEGDGMISRTKKYFRFPDKGYLFFDFDDLKRFNIASIEDAFDCLCDIYEGLKGKAYIAKPSSSSYINGAGLTGVHIYVPVTNMKYIDKFVDYMFNNAFVKGYGYIFVSKSGALLERVLFDKAVFSPERIIYETPPILESGISKINIPAIAYDGNILELPEKYPNLTFKANEAIKKLKAKEKRNSDAIIENLCKNYKGDVRNYRNVLKSFNSNNKYVTGDFLLYFDDLDEPITVREVFEMLEDADGKTLKDPIDPHRNNHAIFYSNLDTHKPPCIFSHKHGGYTIELRKDTVKADLVEHLPKIKYTPLDTELLPFLDGLEKTTGVEYLITNVSCIEKTDKDGYRLFDTALYEYVNDVIKGYDKKIAVFDLCKKMLDIFDVDIRIDAKLDTIYLYKDGIHNLEAPNKITKITKFVRDILITLLGRYAYKWVFEDKKITTDIKYIEEFVEKEMTKTVNYDFNVKPCVNGLLFKDTIISINKDGSINTEKSNRDKFFLDGHDFDYDETITDWTKDKYLQHFLTYSFAFYDEADEKVSYDWLPKDFKYRVYNEEKSLKFIDYILEIIGGIITGHLTEQQKIVLFYGSTGRNGKGVLARLIELSAKGKATTFKTETVFTQQDRYLRGLINYSIWIDSEVSGKTIKEHATDLKEISGKVLAKVRKFHTQDQSQHEITVLPVLLTNEELHMKTLVGDNAFMSRLLPIEITNNPGANKRGERIVNIEEKIDIQYFVSLCINKYRKALQRKEFSYNHTDFLQEKLENTLEIAYFIEHLEHKDGSRIPINDALKSSIGEYARNKGYENYSVNLRIYDIYNICKSHSNILRSKIHDSINVVREENNFYIENVELKYRRDPFANRGRWNRG